MVAWAGRTPNLNSKVERAQKTGLDEFHATVDVRQFIKALSQLLEQYQNCRNSGAIMNPPALPLGSANMTISALFDWPNKCWSGSTLWLDNWVTVSLATGEFLMNRHTDNATDMRGVIWHIQAQVQRKQHFSTRDLLLEIKFRWPLARLRRAYPVPEGR